MEFIKRNLPLILLIVASVIILSSFTYAFVKKDNITFYLKDIKGDRSALNDIIITGVLQDRFHGQYFEIKEGKVHHRFKYYDNSSDFIEDYDNYFGGIRSGDLVYWFQNSYEIAPDADTKTTISKRNTYGELVIEERTISTNKVEVITKIKVMHKDSMKNIDKDSFSIDTGIIIEGNGFEHEISETVEKLPDGTEYTVSRSSAIKKLPINGNNLSNCMALMDNKLYFVVPTTKKCSGENGIFVVDEFEPWWMVSFDENGKERKLGKGRKIVKLDLSKQNIDILGLETVNEQLVLVMMVDNILTLKTYDREGNFIDEIYFEDIDLAIGGGQAPLTYESFVNENILNLSINTGSYGAAQPQALISVEIGDNIREKQIVQNPDFINESTQHYNIYTKGNKLYIVTNVQRLTESGILRPQRFIIMVYENAELLYKGELVTDADEDLEIERLKSQSDSFGYNMHDFRHFVDIELR